MPVQFPNFLQVPVQTPDYSGVGNAVGNFYEGYNAPKDALIKSIQAEFARPKAEQELLASKLSNRKTQMQMQQEAQQLAQQRQFEQVFQQALSGGNRNIPSDSQQPMASPSQLAQNPQTSQSPRAMTYANDPASFLATINPALGKALQSPLQMQKGNGQQPISSANASTEPGAMDNSSGSAEPNEIVVTKGSPHLAGIDKLYEDNPLSRQFLEKKGYKKKQDIKFDNKTGKTSIITQYPSGKVTVQSSGGNAGSDEASLTTKMISKHQNIISSIDTALPLINEILDKGKGTQPYPRSPGMGYVPGWSSASTKYEATVKSALDSLLGAYGLPMTNEGINTVKDQLLIGHGETVSNYKRRLKDLVADLNRRKLYSETAVKRSNKINPVSGMGNNENSYSSNEWNVTNDEQ